jgi:hypothetical protein
MAEGICLSLYCLVPTLAVPLHEPCFVRAPGTDSLFTLWMAVKCAPYWIIKKCVSTCLHGIMYHIGIARRGSVVTQAPGIDNTFRKTARLHTQNTRALMEFNVKIIWPMCVT